MTGRILVVDDIEANVKLLSARLSAEYFEVEAASNGYSALSAIEKKPFDVILLDVMMPNISGFDICKRIKADKHTRHIPVVLITALKSRTDRIKGLEAGADDFLTKPVDDVELVTRVKNLIRLKRGMDELRMRARNDSELTMLEDLEGTEPDGINSTILYVDDDPHRSQVLSKMLEEDSIVICEKNAARALFTIIERLPELIIINSGLSDYDPFRLVAHLRSQERTRHIPIILISAGMERKRLLKAMELGVNDFVQTPIDTAELKLRSRAQIKSKRTADRLLFAMQQTIEMAITDALTGLYNRRFFEHRIKSYIAHAINEAHPLALMMLDIDHFKQVNDTYGHDAGDQVLVEFARRLKSGVRGLDLVCRLGGEEFVVVTPESDLQMTQDVAERLRESIADKPFFDSGSGQSMNITTSIGLTVLSTVDERGDILLKRADEALYEAKRQGRNRVITVKVDQ
ncbi:PleD family two-component system response regulator [Flexibacterium corallicola]|uniref:PleD family two-component system response regulator n=1 Tax=Flexibacterium corallicola TaxID=3037259 RepID=UPI00286EDF1C|nr:PleD family two-component system response regulator [Pseudovibrio sp. M1P-2-3]